MGRRALRKTDPALDLAGHLKTFDDLSGPWDPETLFGRRAALEVEVGSGKGLFLRTAAAANPETDFLGIELAGKYAQFAAAGLAKRNLTNAVVVIADAIRLFDEVFPDDGLAAVHLYFPDPWWKKRHKKRRLMRESWVRDLQRTLRPGGCVHFWTDVEETFQTGVALLTGHTDLEGPIEVAPAAAAHDMDYRTHFERRTRLQGQRVYRAKFRKPADSALQSGKNRTV